MILLEWLIYKTLTASNVGKGIEQPESSFIAGDDAKWYRHLEDSLAVYYKTKHTFNVI